MKRDSKDLKTYENFAKSLTKRFKKVLKWIKGRVNFLFFIIFLFEESALAKLELSYLKKSDLCENTFCLSLTYTFNWGTLRIKR